MRRLGSSTWFVLVIPLCLMFLPGCSILSEPEPLGPFAVGEVARVGDLTLELLPVVHGEPGWGARSERESVNATTVTIAGEGKHYVDVAIKVEDLTLGPDPNAQLPPHGDPYAIVDGEQVAVGDQAVESYTDEAPANRLLCEFAIPDDAQDVVVFLPLEVDSGPTVSFRVR